MKRKAIITGAEQGLGAAIWERLRKRDFEVINIPREILHPYNPEEITQFLFEVDLKNVTDVINNFGINHLSKIGQTLKSDSDILMTNVMAPYWVVNILVCRGLRNVNCINIASQTYKVPQRCTSLYCASKAALVQMTKVMARELAVNGWKVNALAPGKIMDTEMSRLTDKQVLELRGWDADEADKYALSMIPKQRFTSTSEVSRMVMQMIDFPDYITGHCVDFTGGV